MSWQVLLKERPEHVDWYLNQFDFRGGANVNRWIDAYDNANDDIQTIIEGLAGLMRHARNIKQGQRYINSGKAVLGLDI